MGCSTQRKCQEKEEAARQIVKEKWDWQGERNQDRNITGAMQERDNLFLLWKKGHYLNDCPLKDRIAKEKWAHKKGPQWCKH